MVLVGLSWLTYWVLVDVFTVEALKAALATGLIYLVVGLVIDRPWVTRA